MKDLLKVIPPNVLHCSLRETRPIKVLRLNEIYSTDPVSRLSCRCAFQEFEKELKEEMKDDEMERKTENPEKKEV
jgi:hypothetical protein